MKFRKLFRILAIVGALIFTARQVLVARQEYRKLQSSIEIGDRSGVDAYQLNLEIDGLELLATWGFAAGLVYVLRPSPKQ